MHNFLRRVPTAPRNNRELFFKMADRFERKSTHHLRRRGTSEQLSFAHALLSGHGFGTGLASDMNSRRRLAKNLVKGVSRADRDRAGTEHRFVTILFDDLLTSDECTVLDLTALKRRSRPILAAMSSHYIGTIELQVMTNVRHADGGKELCAHGHASISGPDLGDRAYAVAERINQRLGPLANGMEPVHVTEAASDLAALRRMLMYPFKPPDKNKTLFISADGSRSNLHESIKGDRMIRYERQFELLTELDLRQLLFAGGEGRAIKTAALHKAGAMRRTPQAAAEISNFWRTWRQETKTTRFKRPIVK